MNCAKVEHVSSASDKEKKTPISIKYKILNIPPHYSLTPYVLLSNYTLLYSRVRILGGKVKFLTFNYY